MKGGDLRYHFGLLTYSEKIYVLFTLKGGDKIRGEKLQEMIGSMETLLLPSFIMGS